MGFISLVAAKIVGLWTDLICLPKVSPLPKQFAALRMVASTKVVELSAVAGCRRQVVALPVEAGHRKLVAAQLVEAGRRIQAAELIQLVTGMNLVVGKIMVTVRLLNLCVVGYQLLKHWDIKNQKEYTA